jgi:hypothetical protein
VDEYLQDKTHTTLGIKRRGDTVEIKGLFEKPNKTLSFALCQSQIELWGNGHLNVSTFQEHLCSLFRRRDRYGASRHVMERWLRS